MFLFSFFKKAVQKKIITVVKNKNVLLVGKVAAAIDAVHVDILIVIVFVGAG